MNLSAPGRGYLATPRSCDNSPCTPFGGTVSSIAKVNPDVVITFGGIADGSSNITDPAAEYFNDLRTALPKAELVAISTVTGNTTPPTWVEQHAESIRVAVKNVDGIFVDVGQPALGDGAKLSTKAQAEIARAVIKALA